MQNLIKELKTLLRHGLTYGIGQILSRIVGFLMIPVYTHYLIPKDYGIYQLVGITLEVIGIVLGFGIASAVYRFYYDDKEAKDPNIVISTACVGIPIISLLVLGILSVFSKYIASLILEGSEQTIFIVLALGTLWFNQQVSLVYTYLRVVQSSGTYLILSLSKLIMTLSLNIYFIVFLEWGVLGLFTANLISAALFSMISYPFLLKKVGLSFSFYVAKKMLRFSLPIIPANLASLAVNASDRYFIRAFLSLSDVGIYSLGYRLGSVVFALVRVPFMQIWEPRRYMLYRDGASPEIYARIATYFTGVMIFFGLGISVFVQDIIKIISPEEYWGAAIFVAPVVLCYIIYAMDHHVAFGILIKNRTEYWTYVNLSMGALNLALNFVLIKKLGTWGAILATFLSLVFKITALHLIGRKFFQIPFEWTRMAGLLSMAIIIYLLSIIIHPASLGPSLLFDSAILALFLPAIWITGLIAREEKDQTINAMRKFFHKNAVKGM
jgi:O-antigen/teichoic acid export membrane protein